MVKLLQCSFLLKIFAVSVLVIFCGAITVSGQISVKSDQSHQISFTSGETVIDDRTSRISLSDISILSSYTHSALLSEKNERTENNFYVSESVSEIAVGKLSSEEMPADMFFPVSYVNNTGQPIGGFQLSFDFIYNLYSYAEDHTLALKYRVNDGEFRDTESGIMQFEMLSSNKDEWSTFSIQMSIHDLYLRSGDRVEFIWYIRDYEPGEQSGLPIALSRIDSKAVYHTVENAEPGSLIISELLPPFTHDGRLYEYIEIYNPSDYRVSLKGLEIHTPAGEYVIQNDKYIEPFGLTLLSSGPMDFDDNPQTGTIQYTESLLSSSGGRIELLRDGNSISLATYEAAEEGVSLELNYAVNAYDGYTSLINFEVSEIQFNENVFGSPGSLGKTVPLYKHTLDTDGWFFYSPPGRMINQLNRNQNVYFFDSEMNAIAGGDIEPFSPVLMFKERSESSFLHVEQVNDQEMENTFLDIGGYARMMQTPTHQTAELNTIANELGNRISPAALVWNHHQNKFDLIKNGTDMVEGWQPFIVNRSVSDQVQILDKERVAGTPDLTRYIDISLHEDNSSRVVDETVVGFITQPGSQQNRNYSLPKLLTDFDRNNDRIQPDHSYIYLTSQISDEPTNSFLHLPGMIDSSYELRLGHYLKTEGTRASISWNISREVPEEWIIELLDTQSGEVIDMREANSYSFISGAEEKEISKDGDSPITVLPSGGDERFLVTLKPYESLVEEETDDTPESVELRQNYPNPFNPATNIVYFLPEAQQVRVGVYNVVGQQVAVLVDETVRAGEHSVIWNASDMPSGIYIVQLETGNRIFTRKITLIK